MKIKFFIIVFVMTILCSCNQEDANDGVVNGDDSGIESSQTDNTDSNDSVSSQISDSEETVSTTPDDKTVFTENILLENSDKIELLSKLEGHQRKVWSLDASNHNTFASGDSNGNIILWDATTLEKLRVVDAHSAYVEELYFLNNGDILSISDDNALNRTSASTGEVERLYRGATKELTFSKDEQFIAISKGDSEVVIYTLDDFEIVQTIKFTHGCFDIRFDSTAEHLFSVGEEGRVQKWNLQTAELVYEYEGISRDVHCLEITHDDKYIVAGATDSKVCVWDVETGELISSYRHSDGLYDVDISADGRLIASVGVDRKLKIAELQSGTVLKTLSHGDELLAVAFDPNSNYIVTGGYDSYVYVWGVDTNILSNLEMIYTSNIDQVELLGTLKDHEGVVFNVKVSHSCDIAASSERGDAIKVNIWDIANQEVVQSFDTDQAVGEFDFTSDDRYLICRGEMGDLKIWDLIEQNIIFNSKDINEMIVSMDISSDNSLLVTGGKGDIKVWDFETMEILREATFDDEYITQAIFSPDDSMIAYAYAGSTTDFSTHVIDANTFDELYRTEGHTEYNYTIIFSESSNYLASCSGDKLIKFWNPVTGELLQTFRGHTGKVMDIDLSLNEDVLISGSAHDRTIRIWSVETGEQLKKLLPGEEVQTIDMASNGKFFVSAGESGLISIWGVKNVD